MEPSKDDAQAKAAGQQFDHARPLPMDRESIASSAAVSTSPLLHDRARILRG
ncbi:hypothetical protein BAUCODRAFT_36591 [Baudoinia panamericana UAMH 10762]|uniref:Uncharacterized protein n=1 Tax=Baudoinia panamericana (strain UAMH 10762) TaxID=717646 RepID=M2LIU3_BAUPA|nr:uncharacterized protein BAUCODRAFT_36591 [Baudoinia panamericana UAMH 10762]EMC94117.1 hypothetical protein BAUCODRAFT_36591 [Baudoinia panamericana UAMH 10762]